MYGRMLDYMLYCVWPGAGLSMVGCWTMYGRVLDYVWSGAGLCMAGCWSMYGRVLDYVWPGAGLCMIDMFGKLESLIFNL